MVVTEWPMLKYVADVGKLVPLTLNINNICELQQQKIYSYLPRQIADLHLIGIWFRYNKQNYVSNYIYHQLLNNI